MSIWTLERIERSKIMEYYYKGFEGYPEIDFYTYIDAMKLGIEMWEGYFDNIMKEINPRNRRWTLSPLLEEWKR